MAHLLRSHASQIHSTNSLHHSPLPPSPQNQLYMQVSAMERASGRPIKYVIGERRPGDLDEVYSDPSKVSRGLMVESGLVGRVGSGERSSGPHVQTRPEPQTTHTHHEPIHQTP